MIRCLNLDSMFIPVPYPEIRFEQLKFSGGEMHIKLNNRVDYKQVEKVIITHRVNSMDDFMMIMLAKNALYNKGIRVFDLIMPYMPYARQDRVCAPGDAFSLKVFSMMLNTARFNNIHVLDAHSNITSKMISYGDYYNHSNYKYVLQAVQKLDLEDLYLISPDKGAEAKARNLYYKINGEGEYFNDLLYCEKTRDPITGKLYGFDVGSWDLKGVPCLIVDDICDGGGTFLGLAEELKKQGAGDLYLFVTHGIFSKDLKSLGNIFKHIYTTNSINDIDVFYEDGSIVRVVKYKIEI